MFDDDQQSFSLKTWFIGEIIRGFEWVNSVYLYNSFFQL